MAELQHGFAQQVARVELISKRTVQPDADSTALAVVLHRWQQWPSFCEYMADSGHTENRPKLLMLAGVLPSRIRCKQVVERCGDFGGLMTSSFANDWVPDQVHQKAGYVRK